MDPLQAAHLPLPLQTRHVVLDMVMPFVLLVGLVGGWRLSGGLGEPVGVFRLAGPGWVRWHRRRVGWVDHGWLLRMDRAWSRSASTEGTSLGWGSWVRRCQVSA